MFIGYQICLAENGKQPTGIFNSESCYIHYNIVHMHEHTHVHTSTQQAHTHISTWVYIGTGTDTQMDKQTCDIAASMTVMACRIQCLPTWPSVMSTLILSSGTYLSHHNVTSVPCMWVCITMALILTLFPYEYMYIIQWFPTRVHNERREESIQLSQYPVQMHCIKFTL